MAAAGRDTPLPRTASATAEAPAKARAAAPKSGKVGSVAEAPAVLDPTLNAPADSTIVADVVAKTVQAAQAACKAKSDPFYAKRDTKRALTRPSELPDTQAGLLERVKKELDSLYAQAQEHIAQARTKLRLQVLPYMAANCVDCLCPLDGDATAASEPHSPSL